MSEQKTLLEKWTEPHVIIAGFGYISLVVGAFMSFDGRIANNEKDIKTNRDWIVETRDDLQRMNDKLDRLIERRD